MSKKTSKAPKKNKADGDTKAAKPAKAKSSKPEQLKIAGTGRTDAIEEIEKQAEIYVTARDARMEQQAEEDAEQERLTQILKKHGKTTYVFEDSEGIKREAYIPAEARAKVRKAKAPETDAE